MKSGGGSISETIQLFAGSALGPLDPAGCVTLLAGETFAGGQGGCVSACAGRAPGIGASISGRAGQSRGTAGASAALLSGGSCQSGGDVGLCTAAEGSSRLSGTIRIASRRATTSSGTVHLASGAGGRAGGMGLCGGSSRDADGSGVLVRAGSSGPGASGAGGNVGGGAGHGCQGGDLRVAAGNGQTCPGGGVSVSSGASSAASTGAVAIWSREGSRDSGMVHVATGEAGRGASGRVRLATGDARGSGRLNVAAGLGGSHDGVALLCLGAGSVLNGEASDQRGGNVEVYSARGVSGGKITLHGGFGARASAESLEMRAGSCPESQAGTVHVLSAGGHASAGSASLRAAFGREDSGGSARIGGGDSAFRRGGSFRIISGTSADVALKTSPNKCSGRVKISTGNAIIGKPGSIGIAPGGSYDRAGNVVALAGVDSRPAQSGGSVQVYGGRSGRIGGGLNVLAGEGLTGWGGGALVKSGASNSGTGGAVCLGTGGCSCSPSGFQGSGRVLVASGGSGRSGPVVLGTKDQRRRNDRDSIALRAGQSGISAPLPRRGVGGDIKMGGGGILCVESGQGQYGGGCRCRPESRQPVAAEISTSLVVEHR